MCCVPRSIDPDAPPPRRRVKVDPGWSGVFFGRAGPARRRSRLVRRLQSRGNGGQLARLDVLSLSSVVARSAVPEIPETAGPRLPRLRTRPDEPDRSVGAAGFTLRS